jgi:hypothetical protein
MRKRLSEKEIQIHKMFVDARDRSKEKNVPFNITREHLKLIATDECPIFKTPFEWGRSGLGYGKPKLNGPQLDRIIPDLGYVEGNVAFISRRANRIKDNGTMQEHYDIADWIWANTHAGQKESTSVSNHHSDKSRKDGASRFISGTRIGQDSNGAHHHSEQPEGKNTNCGTQKSCGICMGAGDNKMETLVASYRFNSFGEPFETLEQFARSLGCVCYQCREHSLVG